MKRKHPILTRDWLPDERYWVELEWADGRPRFVGKFRDTVIGTSVILMEAILKVMDYHTARIQNIMGADYA